MGKKIIINPKKVYEMGTKYKNEADEIKYKKRELEEIVYRISQIWKGTASVEFQASFSQHIYELTEIIDFLNDKSIILKASALEHNNNDNNFSTIMKKR